MFTCDLSWKFFTLMEPQWISLINKNEHLLANLDTNQEVTDRYSNFIEAISGGIAPKKRAFFRK